MPGFRDAVFRIDSDHRQRPRRGPGTQGETRMRLLTLADFQAAGWHVDNPATGALVDGIVATQAAAFATFGIAQDIHIVHLMAQLSHESGEGTEMVESLNYRPAALLSQWSRHFTPAQAMQYGRTADHPADQAMIGEIAYGGRNGNAPAPSTDGYDFRGRGFIQTTGRANYAALATRTGLDLVAHPELLVDPDHAFTCAVAEFTSYPNILTYCASDNVLAVSSLINMGHLSGNPSDVVGYADRVAQLRLWKQQYGF
jgi:putative chitinase